MKLIQPNQLSWNLIELVWAWLYQLYYKSCFTSCRQFWKINSPEKKSLSTKGDRGEGSWLHSKKKSLSYLDLASSCVSLNITWFVVNHNGKSSTRKNHSFNLILFFYLYSISFVFNSNLPLSFEETGNVWLEAHRLFEISYSYVIFSPPTSVFLEVVQIAQLKKKIEIFSNFLDGKFI